MPELSNNAVAVPDGANPDQLPFDTEYPRGREPCDQSEQGPTPWNHQKDEEQPGRGRRGRARPLRTVQERRGRSTFRRGTAQCNVPRPWRRSGRSVGSVIGCHFIQNVITNAVEWDTVFLIGCSEGILPCSRSTDIEEERRLAFVAVTRARKRLYLSYAAWQKNYDSNVKGYGSRAKCSRFFSKGCPLQYVQVQHQNENGSSKGTRSTNIP